MLYRLSILILAVLAACTKSDNDLLVGTWTINENVSDQVYEAEFGEDGSLEFTRRGKTVLARYELNEVSNHHLLKIYWDDKSTHMGWLRINADGSITQFSYNGESEPDFSTASRLGDMKKASRR